MITELMKANVTGLKNVNFENNSDEFDELATSIIDSYIDSLPFEARISLRKNQLNINLKRLLNVDYKKDPKMFDRLTKVTIDNFIKSQSSKNQKRAYWAQLQIERELKKFPTPLGRWQKMQEIFITEVFEKEGGFIDVMSRFKMKRDGISHKTKTVREITPLRLITNENKDL